MTYLEMVKEDVMEAIKEYNSTDFSDRDEMEEKLNDDLWTDDSVTGNGSGSYTFNRLKARDYVLEDMETVAEALKAFCTPAEEIGNRFLNEDWEYLDVTARCYVLGMAISEVLDEMEDELIFAEDEE